MGFKERSLTRTLSKALKSFPAVVLTGPRQSGKTTLLKALFSKTHTYVSLEDPDIRLRTKEDPLAFLAQYPPPLIIDEIQYIPELLSFIKTRIDDHRKPGHWILTGSQNFALMQNVTQSLAGRAAVLSLLPFSYAECVGNALGAKEGAEWVKNLKSARAIAKSISLGAWLLRGSFPEIVSHPKVDRQLWCGSYITTYLERDVRNMASIGNLTQFEQFLRLCATRTAQILNLSEMARELGISVPTAKRWLSILEAGYQVYLLYPYYRNLGKRIVKSPKLYFTDTGLASYLLGLNEISTLVHSPSFGPLFETMVVCDFLKRFLHSGQKPPLYYLRSRDGLEVDLVVDLEDRLHLFEIKSAVTITPKHANSLRRSIHQWGPKVGSASIISAAPSSYPLTKDIFNFSWQPVLSS
ncbi:MAG: ATP-binding protein [Elusimicrobia bacterium]|nr:ATP-binding protein [Elusimicrobiota bacterium]